MSRKAVAGQMNLQHGLHGQLGTVEPARINSALHHKAAAPAGTELIAPDNRSGRHIGEAGCSRLSVVR